MKTVVLKLARDDLREINDYLSKFGVNPPKRFRESFQKFCVQVDNMPYIYSQYDPNPKYRKAVIEYDYLVFYQVEDSNRRVRAVLSRTVSRLEKKGKKFACILRKRLFYASARCIMQAAILGGALMEYITTQEAAEMWGIKIRRVQALCDNGQIENATRLGQIWVIPNGTPKPIDGRTKAAKQNGAHKTDMSVEDD